MEKLFKTLKFVLSLVLLLSLIACSGSEPTKEPQNTNSEQNIVDNTLSEKTTSQEPQSGSDESIATTQSTNITQTDTISADVTEHQNTNSEQSIVDETLSENTTSALDVNPGRDDPAVASDVEQQNGNSKSENPDNDDRIIDQKQITGLLDYGTTCAVILTRDSRFNYAVQVTDEDSNVLQSISPKNDFVSGIEICDVNTDGYEDIVVISSNIFDGMRELLLWDISAQQFRRAEFLGFEELRYFEIEDGYINHWIDKWQLGRRDIAGAGVKQKLVWNGYSLIHESEEIITEFPFDTQTYEYRPEPDRTIYTLTSIMNSYNKDYRIQLFDTDGNLQSSIELDESVHQIGFQDVNMDGYEDVVIGYDGALNQPHDLLVWNNSTKSLNNVVYVGFDMLSHFEIHDGYLMCWGKDTASTGSIQKLVWNGNSLILESEERYETWD